MAEDYVYEMFKEAIEEVIQEKIEKGASEKEIEKLTSQNHISDTYNKIVKHISNDFVKTIENIMYEKVLTEDAYVNEFLARQNQKWGKAFVVSDVLYLCVLESAETYVKYVNETYGQKVSFLYRALLNIHGRALQIYLEIMCLNKNGFADGAYARWRSLYELSVISAFISKYGEKVAEAFIKSAKTNDRYEWARTAECLKNYRTDRKITFDAIQSKCKIVTKEWRKEYSFACKLVHASSQGTMYRLGANTSKGIPVGRTDFGMGISAMHSAISLSQITTQFFTVYPHSDSTVAIIAFRKWVNEIGKYYKRIEEIDQQIIK